MLKIWHNKTAKEITLNYYCNCAQKASCLQLRLTLNLCPASCKVMSYNLNESRSRMTKACLNVHRDFIHAAPICSLGFSRTGQNKETDHGPCFGSKSVAAGTPSSRKKSSVWTLHKAVFPLNASGHHSVSNSCPAYSAQAGSSTRKTGSLQSCFLFKQCVNTFFLSLY